MPESSISEVATRATFGLRLGDGTVDARSYPREGCQPECGPRSERIGEHYGDSVHQPGDSRCEWRVESRLARLRQCRIPLLNHRFDLAGISRVTRHSTARGTHQPGDPASRGASPRIGPGESSPERHGADMTFGNTAEVGTDGPPKQQRTGIAGRRGFSAEPGPGVSVNGRPRVDTGQLRLNVADTRRRSGGLHPGAALLQIGPWEPMQLGMSSSAGHGESSCSGTAEPTAATETAGADRSPYRFRVAGPVQVLKKLLRNWRRRRPRFYSVWTAMTCPLQKICWRVARPGRDGTYAIE